MFYSSFRKSIRNVVLNSASNFSKPKPGIHILNGHFLSLNDEAENEIFKNLINCLQNNGIKFVDFEIAVSKIRNKQLPKKDCLVAFSFDDGFKECFSKIRPVLNEYHIKAAFFINPGFINGDSNYRKNFKENIVFTNKEPMNWEEIEILKNENHTIGAHTVDHLNLSELDEDSLHIQLGECKRIIESKLNIVCKHFAFPFGKLKHFNQQALEISKQYFQYIYSQSNYRNYFSFGGKVINRRHFECDWPTKHVIYFLKDKKYNA